LLPFMPSPLAGEGTMVVKRVVMGEGVIAKESSRGLPSPLLLG
jgi:hypothetical protein